jgi:hypothetical protein
MTHNKENEMNTPLGLLTVIVMVLVTTGCTSPREREPQLSEGERQLEEQKEKTMLVIIGGYKDLAHNLAQFQREQKFPTKPADFFTTYAQFERDEEAHSWKVYDNLNQPDMIYTGATGDIKMFKVVRIVGTKIRPVYKLHFSGTVNDKNATLLEFKEDLLRVKAP